MTVRWQMEQGLEFLCGNSSYKSFNLFNIWDYIYVLCLSVFLVTFSFHLQFYYHNAVHNMLWEPIFIKFFIKFSCGSLNGCINCLFSLYFSVPVWWGNIFSLFQSLLWYLLELFYGLENNHFVDFIWTSVPVYLALLKVNVHLLY